MREVDVSTSANGEGTWWGQNQGQGVYKALELEFTKGRAGLLASVIGAPVVRVEHEAGGWNQNVVTGESTTTCSPQQVARKWF